MCSKIAVGWYSSGLLISELHSIAAQTLHMSKQYSDEKKMI
jgi:hypothetical protein